MKLPRLSAEEQSALRQRAQKGDRKAKDELILSVLALVYKIARSVKLPRHTEVDDIAHAGVVGLIRAIEKFDPSRDVKFTTYAGQWIWLGIMHALYAARGWTRADGSRAKLARDYQLRVEAGESEEVAAEQVGRGTMRYETVRAVHASIYRKEVSLAAPAGRDGGQSGSTVEDHIPCPKPLAEELFAEEETTARLAAVVDAFSRSLSPRERDILRWRFLEDEPKTLAELGEDWQLSRERIRQLEGGLRRRLRRRLQEAIRRRARVLEGENPSPGARKRFLPQPGRDTPAR